MFHAMSMVLLSWLLFGTSITGTGLLVRRVSRRHWTCGEDVWLDFWIGWCVVVAALQLWHFVLPVDGRAVVALVLLAACGFIVGRKDVAKLFKGLRPSLLYVALLLALVVWLSNFAIGPLRSWDGGLYHLSAIRWNRTYAIVPGLGNLHHRLAFNNSSFLYCALLDFGPWQGLSRHLANGLLLVVFLAMILHCVLKALRGEKLLPRQWLLVILAVPAAMQIPPNNVSITSPSTDLTIFYIGAVALYFAMGAINRNWSLALALVVSTLVVVKLSAVFLGIGLLTAVLSSHVWKMVREHDYRLAILNIAGCAIIGLMVGIPWMVRGVVLSGYPAFPNTAISFDVPWRVPEAIARAEAKFVRHSARWIDGPIDTSTGSLGWIKANVRRTVGNRWATLNVFLPLLIGAGFVLANVLSQNGLWATARERAIVLALVVAIGCWIVMAPRPRFGYFVLWLFAAYVGSPLLSRRLICPRSLAVAVWIILGLAVVSFWCILGKSVPLQRPGQRGFWREPRPELISFRTDSGLELWVPEDLSSVWCFDGPLPCTPYRYERLRLRQPRNVQGGFILEEPSVPQGTQSMVPDR